MRLLYGKTPPRFFQNFDFRIFSHFLTFRKTLGNFGSPHLRYIISRQPLVLGPYNLACSFYIEKSLPVFFRISIFEFLAIFRLFEKTLSNFDRLGLGTSYLGNHNWCYIGPCNYGIRLLYRKTPPHFFSELRFSNLNTFLTFRKKHLVIFDRLSLGTSYFGNHWC